MLAIIPARGGSKGLPGKNIMPLNGKPLIAYSIQQALNSRFISRVYVSTDDNVIAEVARSFGADCPSLRPGYLAQDDSKAIDTYLYTVDMLEEQEEGKYESIVVLQPTSPLRLTSDIDSAIEKFHNKKADSVVSYCELDKPLPWIKRINKDDQFVNIFDDSVENRQRCEKGFYPNGSVYVFSVDLLRAGKYYSENSYAYIMPKSRSVDIDYIDDFRYAEYLMSYEHD